jgi:Zn-dependent protease
MNADAIVSALVAVIIMLLVGFPIHEFLHAWTAYRLGDNTARWQGRLTLDPRVHFDPIGGLMLVITAVISGGRFFFGFAKPTPVNPMNLQGGRRGEALVAAAGPLSNLVLATIVAIPIRYIIHTPDLAPRFFIGDGLEPFLMSVAIAFLSINILLFLFNLIPIPPLDGWAVLLGLVPGQTAYQLREFQYRYAQIIPFVFLAFIFLLGGRILGPILDTIRNLLLGV